RARSASARRSWLDQLLETPVPGAATPGSDPDGTDTGNAGDAAFLTWWRSRTPAEMARLDDDSWRARFRLVHRPDRWTPPAEARANLLADRIFAWIEIPEDPVGAPGREAEPLRYTGANLTNQDLRDWFEDSAARVLERQRRDEAGLSARVYQWVRETPVMDVRTLGGTDASTDRSASVNDVLAQWGPVAFVYILWVSILVVTQMLMTSTVEEKSNKLVEVLLSTLSPLELMTGKMLGIGATGLTIVGTWLGTFALATLGLPALLGAPASLDLGALIAPAYLGAFVVYFLLGYFFYAALLCGLGALCNSLKEAQTLIIPIQGLLIVPLMTMIPIARDPSGTLATLLSWVPPFTPFVMMNRAAQPPSAWVYGGTTLLMILSIAAALWAGAKIFRIGILMTGQPPRLREVLRWIAAPVGGPRHSPATAAVPASSAHAREGEQAAP
ncbi:MAG: ABC transporter permease, partial [Pseudomonadales bacterium]|nr:ABC transporter permease [Pseudomonadales bacterium]